MKHRCTRSKLPVSKANEALYEKAISRISKQTCVDECWPGDLIAVQEQEIKRYRSKIYFLEEELKKQKSEEAAQVELVAERIAFDDGVLHLSKGDVLILKAEHVLTREAMDDIINKLNHHGIDCVVLHKSIEIAGVIKGGI